MLKKAPSVCPVCGKSLIVKKLECSSCNTALENEFSFNVFERLNEQQQNFVLMFMFCEGNIRMLEQALGISYPTVKNRLCEIKRVLGDVPDTKRYNSTMSILESLERGEITAEQAVAFIRGARN